ncbi:peptidoglycan-binding domain-containing protein [Aquimarina agarilytica]|uniref:peptidoglycan-binding domain-containing protein n=1 Tax=Aquimarina agarilytica TaxID=1087449 RepID=UPI000289CA40|nr:peptidoglycan-binding domain-containing protein [Aquimarina agarilytica]
MAIYISQKAATHIPYELASTYLPTFLRGSTLKSNYFKGNPFFQNLAVHGNGADTLKKGTTNTTENIQVLQFAIAVVSKKLGIDNTLKADGKFGDQTQNALKNLQKEFKLPQTGELDSQTLIALDYQLSQNTIYDSASGTFYTNNSETRIVVTKANVSINVTTTLEDTNQIPIDGSEGKVYKIIPKNDTIAFNDTLIFVNDENTTNPSLSQSNLFKLEKDAEGLLIEPPITEQPEPGARLVRVGKDDTIISLIYDEYYKNDYPILKRPNLENENAPENDKTNPSNLIHSFPKRELKKDTRLKFLTNLVYYMNHSPVVNNGIQYNGYSNYTDAHLDEVNIYDNKGYQLNYQVFFDELVKKDDNYNWDFENAPDKPFGFDAPIELPEGSYVWLPSRTYVEGLYYSLNYQPKDGRMYTKKSKPSIDPDTLAEIFYFDWTTQNEHDKFIEKVRAEVVDFVDDVVDTYNEAREYFIKMHGWVKDIAEFGWPRGFGGVAEGGISASAPVFGLPLTANAEGDAYLLRKVTNDEDFVINLREKFAAGIGFAVGASTGSFKTGGKGKSTKNVGAGKGKNKEEETHYGIAASITGQITLNLEMTSVYEFDISKSNTPLIAMTIAMFENTLNNVPSTTGLLKSALKERLFDLSEYFFSINIDPSDYLIHNDAGFYLEGRIYGDAYIGKVPDPDTWGADNVKQVDQLKGGGITALLTKLGGVSANTDNFFRFGGKYTYKAKFDNLPEVYNADFRMPSETSIEGEIYYELQVELSLRFNALLVNFIAGLVNTISPISFIPSFNLHKGIAILYQLSYKRKDIPENHEFFNHKIDASQLFSTTDPNGNITKKVGLKIFSGDLDTPLEPGNESVFFLEFVKIKEFITQVQTDAQIQGNNNIPPSIADYVTNIDTLVELFNSFSIRKRVLIGDRITNKASRKAKKTVQQQNSKSGTFYKKTFKDDRSNFIASLIDDKRKASFITALDAEATLETKEIVNTIKFIYEYLRFAISQVQFTGDNFVIYQKVAEQVASIVCETKAEIAVNSETAITSNSLNTVFETALTKLQNIYTAEAFDTDSLRPYTHIIGDFIQTMDQEGVLNTLKDTPDAIIRTVSPYLSEIAEILKQVIKFLLVKAQLNVAVENKLTFDAALAGNVSKGYKVEFGFYASGGIYSKIDILEKGQLSAIFKPDDPYFQLLQSFIGVLGATSIGPLGLSVLVGNLLIINTANKTQAYGNI